MLRKVLELAGHVVYDAADGVRGLELVNAERPDVGIIDVNLPGIDGYQIAKQIRAEYGRGMLLVGLTGYGFRGEADRSQDDAFDYHFVKPIDPDQLTRLLSGGIEAAQ
jgi:CheY-like chemotaxis protein